MSGLGIVLEEAESPVPSRAILAAPTPQSPRIAPPNFTDSEALLPPLPDDAAATVARTSTASPLVAPSRLHFQMTGSPVASNMEFADESSPSQSISYDNDLVRTQQSHKVLSDLFSDHSMYELDSSALNESTPMSFPPADSTSSGNNTVHSHQPPSSTSGSAGSTTNTSPLKRLKSLKNGIRKLSLSKMSSSSSVSSPVVAETPVAPPRPTLTPTYTDPSQDVSSSSSTGDSLRSSTFSSSAGVGQSAPASGSTPQAPAHIHTASSGSLAKARRRTLSGSHCTSAATTPPLPSPIITLSENLNTTKETMVDIESNFFENIGTVGGAASDKDNLGKLTTSDELIEYSLYLNEHKKLVVGAYDATRERLISSGWCSNHDLENLSLQRDSSLSQIDTKLLQIEEKLNSEYQLSMLNNPTSAMPRGKHASNLREASLSPSLKVLESRCFAFTGSEVELR